jgi:hypothetical protein
MQIIIPRNKRDIIANTIARKVSGRESFGHFERNPNILDEKRLKVKVEIEMIRMEKIEIKMPLTIWVLHLRWHTPP